jgi:hypothetical protein
MFEKRPKRNSGSQFTLQESKLRYIGPFPEKNNSLSGS